MANVNLTPDMITREGLRILHEKLNFVGNINKQYDSSFAVDGAKIGSILRVRKPAQYSVRSGSALAVQDHIENEVPLAIDTQLGVDLEFGSSELTLDIDQFSNRVLEPAMAQLASAVEERVLDLASGQSVVANATADAELFKDVLLAQAYLDNLTTPRDKNRCVLVDTLTQVGLVDALKGLFQDANEVASQYKEGAIGRTAGAMWYQSSRIPTTIAAPEASYAIVSFSGTSMTITATVAGTIEAGTMFKLDTGYAVHPETKKVFTNQFVYVTAQEDLVIAGAGNVVVTIAAPIYSSASDPRQNISAAPVNAVSLAAGLPKSLIFHKDFMTFATADLVMPKGVDMASRQVYDGISMRLVRQYDIQTDSFPVRLDILFGQKVLRPEYGATLVQTY